MKEPRSDPPVPTQRRAVRLGFLVIAATMALVGTAGLMFDGLRIAIGPIRISALTPTHVFFQAAVAWVLADAVGRPRKRSTIVMLPLLALLVAGIADSTPRRVGDGAEYMAMALNLSHGAPPALSESELAATTRRLAATPGFEISALRTPLLGRDGRQDFPHPWLYSLLASPLTAFVDRIGVHPNYSFAVLNLLLVALLLWWLIRNGYAAAATVLAAGPLLWWIDKAHTEVFMFVMLAFAVLLLERRPIAALLAAALAVSQNPAAAIVVAAGLASVLVVRPRTVSLAAVAGVLAICAIMPAYYLWHLGVVSPLGSTIMRGLPEFREFVTPLIDPNLGLLPYAPLLVLLAGVGVTRTHRRTLSVIVTAAIALLAVFAQSGNMNHGGTPGMSRYGLWLLALVVPSIAVGCARLEGTRPVLLHVLAAVSVLFSAYTFRPAWSDRVGSSPNWLAQTIWTRWPAVDNPVPEVFAERISGRDGSPVVPVGTAGCEKLLIRGDGTETWWPFPCRPKPGPDACAAKGALCYVNAGAVTIAPRQRHFIFEEATYHAWTVSTMTRLEPILQLLGAMPRLLRYGSEGGRVVDVIGIEQLYLVQGSSGLAVWVRSYEQPTSQPVIHVKIAESSTVRFLHPDTMMPAADSILVTRGTHTIAVPRATSWLVIVTEVH